MSSIIENYRGFDIEFDVNSKSFYSMGDDMFAGSLNDYCEISNSIDDIRSAIDNFYIRNSSFNQFYVIKEPCQHGSINSRRQYLVIGVRENGVVIVKKDDGKNKGILPHQKDRFMLVKQCNDNLMNDIELIDDMQNCLIKSNSNKKDELYNKLKITTLRQFNNSIILENKGYDNLKLS